MQNLGLLVHSPDTIDPGIRRYLSSLSSEYWVAPHLMSSGLEPVRARTIAEIMVVSIFGCSIIRLAQYMRVRSRVRHDAVRAHLHWLLPIIQCLN